MFNKQASNKPNQSGKVTGSRSSASTQSSNFMEEAQVQERHENLSKGYEEAFANFDRQVEEAKYKFDCTKAEATKGKHISEGHTRKQEADRERWKEERSAKLGAIKQEKVSLKENKEHYTEEEIYKIRSRLDNRAKAIKKALREHEPTRRKEITDNKYDQRLKKASETLKKEIEDAEVEKIKKLGEVEILQIELQKQMEAAGSLRPQK